MFSPRKFGSSSPLLKVKSSSTHESRYSIFHGQLEISSNDSKFDSTLGVSSIEFSHSSRYFSTIIDSIPNILFIYDFKPSLHLAYVLIQLNPIRCVQWQSSDDRLALCAGNKCLYLWSPEGASCINLPNELSEHKIDQLQWNPHSKTSSLALIGPTSVCLGFLDR